MNLQDQHFVSLVQASVTFKNLDKKLLSRKKDSQTLPHQTKTSCMQMIHSM